MQKNIIKAEFREYRELLAKVPSLVLSVLILSVVSMNLLANKELVKTPYLALDCGFVLSWIPFLIMDCICKLYGGKAAARISILSIVVNLVIFAVFKLVSLTPGMWGEYYTTGLLEVNDALNATVGGSSWIVFGSAFAMLVSSMLNSLVNVSVGHFFKGDGYGHFAARSFSSTAVSQFADNFVFALVVSVPLFGWSMRQALICSLTAAAFELLMEVCFSGVGYKLVRRLQKESQNNE